MLTVRPSVSAVGLLASLLLSGCATSHTWHGVTTYYWNESSSNFTIVEYLGYGLPEGQNVSDRFQGGGRYPSAADNGATAWNCPEKFKQEPLPYRIALKNPDGKEAWSRLWSDIGCGVEYDFVYHADGTYMFKLKEKSSDLKRPVPQD